MLEYLRIRDLALIENMELEFSSGMNVLTGETGAGKSFILKAINFLLGEKLAVDMVRPGSQKAQVEALFFIENEQGEKQELILRRELIAESGRSRFFMNGDLSSQDSIRELRTGLILHAGQHGQQRLLQPSFQGRLVDTFLSEPDLVEQKESLFRSLKDVAEKRKNILDKVRTLQDRRELLEIQQKEIEKVAPLPNEEDRLEQMRAALRIAEKAQEQYEKGFLLLRGEDGPGILDLLSQLERLVSGLAQDDENMQAELEGIANFRTQALELERIMRKPPAMVRDILEKHNEELGLEVGNAEELDSRLFALSQLKRKLRRSLPEILDLQKEISENLSFLDACGLDMLRLEKEEALKVEELAALLERLNHAREEASLIFCEKLQEELAGLGFSEQVRVLPEAMPHQLWPPNDKTEGQLCVENKVRLMWAPNPGQTPQALDRIASGGELSRFLLAVVSLQAKGENATLIFDEVDAGVGGITLNRVADRLEQLAAKRQMLLITHWPQLAARAHTQFMVSKEVVDNQTFTRCTLLNVQQRQEELQRMAGLEPEKQISEPITKSAQGALL